jgi:uncharacterized membrane protein HdeD (DUF308 family)
MRFSLARNWWSLVIRGLAGIAFGVITFLNPRITLAALVLLFAAYALIWGVMSIIAGVRAAEQGERWAALIVEGILGILAGAIAVFWPGITILALIFLIGIWAVVSGAFELAAAIRLRKVISGEWLLALGGIASIIFGVLVVSVPVAGALVIALWVGAYAFILGIFQIVLGIRLRGMHGNLWSGPAVPAPAH